MSDEVIALDVPQAPARQWVEQSLAAGHELSTAVLVSVPIVGGWFRTFAPRGALLDQLGRLDEGGVVSSDGADVALDRLLSRLKRAGAKCVVIEDDVLRSSDPTAANVASAFIGEHVVHWCELERSAGVAAAHAIRASAVGYPLNAFVCARSSSDLGLTHGHAATDGLQHRVVDSLRAVIVGAFDAESFLVWERPEHLS